MKFGFMLVAGLLVVSGCMGGTEDDGSGEPEPTGPVYADDASFTVPYNASQCREGIVVILIEFAQAQKHLPSGYKARDAENLLELPIGRGKAAAYLNANTCGQSQLAAGGMDEATFGIYVDPPNVNGTRPPAEPNFYEFGRYTPKEEALLLLRAVNHSVYEGSVQVGLNAQPGNAWTGSANVLNEEGALAYTFGMTAPVGKQPLNALARFWHQGANGTMYFDYKVNTEIAQGTGSCSLRADQPKRIVGITSCANGQAYALVFPNFDWTSEFVYLADSFAT